MNRLSLAALLFSALVGLGCGCGGPRPTTPCSLEITDRQYVPGQPYVPAYIVLEPGETRQLYAIHVCYGVVQ